MELLKVSETNSDEVIEGYVNYLYSSEISQTPYFSLANKAHYSLKYCKDNGLRIVDYSDNRIAIKEVIQIALLQQPIVHPNPTTATLTVPTHLLQTLHQELATTTALWMDNCSRVEYKGKIIKDRGAVEGTTTTIEVELRKGQIGILELHLNKRKGDIITTTDMRPTLDKLRKDLESAEDIIKRIKRNLNETGGEVTCIITK